MTDVKTKTEFAVEIPITEGEPLLLDPSDDEASQRYRYKTHLDLKTKPKLLKRSVAIIYGDWEVVEQANG